MSIKAIGPVGCVQRADGMVNVSSLCSSGNLKSDFPRLTVVNIDDLLTG